MTGTPMQSLKARFTSRDDSGKPVAEIFSKSELSNFLIMLHRRDAMFEVKPRKKTKARSASWLVTLGSPIEALDA